MKILIIDDEKNICNAIKGILEDEGHVCSTAYSFGDGMKLLNLSHHDVVFLDIWLPDIDGVHGLKEIKRRYPHIEIIMITGHGNVDNAVESTRLGAYDFLEKPLSMDRILTIINNINDKIELVNKLSKSRLDVLKKYSLIGQSSPIDSLRKIIDKIAPTNAWVLISGENGTGKEHVARLIHILSKRSEKPFIEINCSAIPSELIETELFGHDKGAFTGAIGKKQGKIELANNGTLFLDEIGDMNPTVQAKLLRVLETGTFMRVGGTEIIKSDFRLISATNRKLEEEVKKGNFREDLYYRVNVIPVEVPALRERREDIIELANHFLSETCYTNAILNKHLSEELINLFINYDWPGNVRQLKNTVERLSVLSEDDEIGIEDVPVQLLMNSITNKKSSQDNLLTLKEAREDFEKRYIIKILTDTEWNITKASQILDVERSHLHKKIKSYNITRS